MKAKMVASYEEPTPQIVVVIDGEEDVLKWYSVGWYDIHHRGTDRAEALMIRATDAIRAASSRHDAIHRLKDAGFDVKTE